MPLLTLTGTRADLGPELRLYLYRVSNFWSNPAQNLESMPIRREADGLPANQNSVADQRLIASLANRSFDDVISDTHKETPMTVRVSSQTRQNKRPILQVFGEFASSCARNYKLAQPPRKACFALSALQSSPGPSATPGFCDSGMRQTHPQPAFAAHRRAIRSHHKRSCLPARLDRTTLP
jgi:hypothetical protein